MSLFASGLFLGGGVDDLQFVLDFFEFIHVYLVSLVVRHWLLLDLFELLGFFSKFFLVVILEVCYFIVPLVGCKIRIIETIRSPILLLINRIDLHGFVGLVPLYTLLHLFFRLFQLTEVWSKVDLALIKPKCVVKIELLRPLNYLLADLVLVQCTLLYVVFLLVASCIVTEFVMICTFVSLVLHIEFVLFLRRRLIRLLMCVVARIRIA